MDSLASRSGGPDSVVVGLPPVPSAPRVGAGVGWWRGSAAAFLLALGALGSLGCRSPGGISDGDVLEVHYEYAGLERIDITRERIRFTYHTLREGAGPRRQDMSSYERHTYDGAMSARDVDLVCAWLTSSNALNLKPPTGTKEVPTYGGAFESSLSIRCGTRCNRIRWSGDSLWASRQESDELTGAITSLRDLCRRVLKVEPAP